MTKSYIKAKRAIQCLIAALLLATQAWAAPLPPPNWSINPDDYEFNMNMVVRVKYNDLPSNAAGNLVGAFVGNELRGVASPVFYGNNAYFFLTIYSNEYHGETVHFKVYVAPQDKVVGAFESELFIHNRQIGKSELPYWLNLDPNADYPPVLDFDLRDTTLQTIPFETVNLNDYLFSADGDPVTWIAQPGPNLTAVINNGVLSVSPVSPAWTGTDTVRIIVRENTPNQKSDTLVGHFTVLPDYGPPVWLNIPDQQIFPGEQFMDFDLDNYLTFNGDCRGFDFDVFPFTGSATDPAWPVVPPGNQAMSVIGRPLFADVQLAGAGSKLAGYVNGTLAGWATPSGAAPNVTYSLLLKNVGSGNITFKFYDAVNHYQYEELSSLAFVAGGSAGSVANPYLLQLSPLIPGISASGEAHITIDDPSWVGNYPVNFIVWDCDYPNLRRDTTQVIFSIVPDARPQFTSSSTVSFEENACSTLYDAQTTDPNYSEGNGLTYSIDGGADAARFAIDPVTGILSWAVGFNPNYESPADADANNLYLVNIKVTNTSSLSDVLSLTVKVTNQTPEPFAVSINGGTSLICSSASVNLQASGAITYMWSTGSLQSAILVTTPGTYTVTGTSSGGCTQSASVTVSAPPAISAFGNTAPVCIGSNISLGSTPSGGAPPYASFVWNGPDNFSANVEDPAGFPAVAASAGVYHVTVTDAAGCSATAQVSISVSGSSAPSVSASSNSPVCEGASISLSSTPSGGSGSGYTFLWAGPNSFGSTAQNPAPFTASTAYGGTYNVTVTDGDGCTASGTTSVQVNSKPMAAASSNSPISVGGSIQLSGSASGGSGSGYAYAWSGPNNYTGNGAQPAPFTATLAAAGVYTLTVTDGNGCSNTATTTVNVVACPGITASVGAAVCEGGTVTLQSTPSGGAQPYASFVWSGPNNFSASVEDPAPFAATTAANGTYTVKVTDQLGCSATATVSVTVYANPSIAAQNTGPVCAGTPVSVSSSPSGGNPGYNFIWTGPDFFGATVEDPASFTATVASGGIYQVKVTDSKGCTATATTTLVVNAKPSITASNNGPLCTGAILNLQSTPSGGSGVYNTFSWNGPQSFSSTLEDPTPFAIASANAGMYNVTVTDNKGCSATASTTLSISNNNAPAISATSNSPLCAGALLSLGSTPSAGSPPYTAFAWSGPNNYTSNQEDPAAFVAPQNGSGNYSVTVTDSKNCKGTASVAVMVFSPSLNPSSNSPVCPGATLQLYSGGQSGSGISYSWSGPNNFSSSDKDPAIPNAAAVASGTYSVTINDNGCIGTASITVSVVDNTPPAITCPANTTVAANASCGGAVGTYSAVTVSDNCNPNPSVSQSPVAGAALSGHNDVKVITLTANDGNGNTASCTFTVTLKDVTPPTITCPTNTTVAADANCSGMVGVRAPTSVSDNCNPNPGVSQSPAANTALSGNNDFEVVTLTASDGNGNSSTCSFTVTLKDVTPPTITCPANTTVAANASCSGVVGAYLPASVSDNCNPSPIVSQSPAANTALNGHNDAKLVTLTAADGNGNSSTCSFTVTLKDITPPSITCPANTTVAADGSCSGVVGPRSPASVSDNCNPSPSVAQSPTASTVLSGHNDFEVVTLTASDGNGNTNTCTFTVTLKDVTPPSITCPTNTTIAADANCSNVVGVRTPVSVGDNCNPSPTVTQSPAPSTVLSGHNDFEIVMLIANDGNGNSNSCTFTLTLKDVTPPSITCPANTTVAADANCSGVVGARTPASLSDNCNPSPTVTQSPAASTVLSGHNDFEIVTLTANDGNGNTSSCNFSVTLKDVTPPSISCPANTTIAADANCSGVVGAYSATAVGDNCNPSPTVTQSPAASTVLSGHNDSKVVTLTANDGNGNTNTCTLTVTLKDITKPVIVCPANTTVAADANCSGVVGMRSPVSVSDNCNPSPTVTQSPAASTTLSGHDDFKLVTLTANDGNGNTQSCTFTVTLKDVTPPTVTCKAFTAALNASGNASITTANVYQSGADNCGTVNQVSVTPNTFNCSNLGPNTVTLNVNDGHGNTNSCNAVVTVVDQIPPTMACKNLSVALNTLGQAGITAAQVNNGSTDNCTLSTLNVVPSSFNCANIGANSVTLTGTDQSGNTATCTSTVTVIDTIKPTMMCKNATLNLNSAGQAILTVGDVNNGSFDNCTITTFTLSKTLFTCADIGQNTVTLQGRDQSNNASSCTATVTISDVTAPMAKCKNGTANIGPNGTVTISPALVDNGSSDNCNITLTVTPSLFNCSQLGAKTVTLKATDQSGNSATCNATVTIKDVTPPTAACKNLTLILNNDGQATIQPSDIDNGSSDNCSISSRIAQITQFNCSDIAAPVNNFLTVKDPSGNSASCTAIITVKDNMAPTPVCKNTSVPIGANGSVTVYPSILADSSFDNCSVTTYLPSAKTYYSIGTYNLLITVKDWSGNPATCTSVVTVTQNSPVKSPLDNNVLYAKDQAAYNEWSVSLHPNPSNGAVQVDFDLPQDQLFTLRVVDLTGREVLRRQEQGLKGNNSIPLQLERLAKGLYLVECRSGDRQSIMRLILQE